MRELNGKIAWVTGAGTGIGEAAAIALAKEGGIILLVTGHRMFSACGMLYEAGLHGGAV